MAPDHRSPAASCVLVLLAAYRVLLSPLMGGTCRYTPTCSVYAQEAIAVHGAWRGGWMALKRLARCHPLGGWGHDPVPAAGQDMETSGSTSPIGPASPPRVPEGPSSVGAPGLVNHGVPDDDTSSLGQAPRLHRRSA